MSHVPTRTIKEIEKQLNEDFERVCNSLVDNKLSVHFVENKIKSISFACKRCIKIARKLNVKYKDIEIKTTFTSNISWLCLR